MECIIVLMVHSNFSFTTSPTFISRWLLITAINLLLVSFFLTACSAEPTERKLRFDTTIYLNQQPLQVAVFKTPEAQRLGLMHVSHLPENTGGLFVFPVETDVNFWMRNVLIGLDLLFFDQHGRLIHWVEAAQPCRTMICPRFKRKKVKYVLEVNAGFVKANKLSESIRLRL